MLKNIKVNFSHARNQGLLDYLLKLARDRYSKIDKYQSCSPNEIDHYNMGIHPDLVQYLWHKLSKILPENCAWVVYNCPVLVHPKNGIIFAFASHSFTYGLRLPSFIAEEVNDKAKQTAELFARSLGNSEDEIIRQIDLHSGYIFHLDNKILLDVRDFGDDWMAGRFIKNEDDYCLKSYIYTGEL